MDITPPERAKILQEYYRESLFNSPPIVYLESIWQEEEKIYPGGVRESEFWFRGTYRKSPTLFDDDDYSTEYYEPQETEAVPSESDSVDFSEEEKVDEMKEYSTVTDVKDTGEKKKTCEASSSNQKVDTTLNVSKF